jgi:hypothetical protein
MLEAPGSYLAYACMYITCCLIKLFTLATNTYEEQHRHIAGTYYCGCCERWCDGVTNTTVACSHK